MPVAEARIRAAFLTFDRDGDGELSVPDALCAIRACGVLADDKEVERLPDHLTHAQFAEWMKQRTASYDAEGELIKLFKVFDRSNTGSIDAEELRQVMKTLSSLLNEQDINQVIQEADPGNTGKINYENFIRNMLSS